MDVRNIRHASPGGVPIDVLIMLNRFHEELRLVAERGIEARRVDLHGRAQLGDRRRLITTAPEHIQGAVERGGTIEGAGPSFAPVGWNSRRGRHILLMSLFYQRA